MEIPIGNYKLTSGTNDFKITETKIIQDKSSKNFGKTADTEPKYFPSLPSCFEYLLKRSMLESEATTLKELLKSHTDARASLVELFGTVS